MRFKRGSKVEIFINKDVPSWRCAEIVSGNGRTYSIRYDCPPGSMNEAAVDRVPRKIIRPSPPAFAVKNWAAGEMVEVFNDLSWKIATVISNMGGNYYLVRLVGSLKELQVSKTDIRVRQTWQYDKWSVIGKVNFFLLISSVCHLLFFFGFFEGKRLVFARHAGTATQAK